MKKNLKHIFILAIVFFVAVPAFAFQGPPPPNGLPIDGFLSVFLAIGAVFGIRSLKRKK